MTDAEEPPGIFVRLGRREAARLLGPEFDVLLCGLSPAITDASLDPMPSRRASSHSGVPCRTASATAPMSPSRLSAAECFPEFGLAPFLEARANASGTADRGTGRRRRPRWDGWDCQSSARSAPRHARDRAAAPRGGCACSPGCDRGSSGRAVDGAGRVERPTPGRARTRQRPPAVATGTAVGLREVAARAAFDAVAGMGEGDGPTVLHWAGRRHPALSPFLASVRAEPHVGPTVGEGGPARAADSPGRAGFLCANSDNGRRWHFVRGRLQAAVHAAPACRT